MGEASSRVFGVLLSRIVGGVYTAGVRLPVERELVGEFGTSRVTVREALTRLADWGLISPRRGSGSTVRDRENWSFRVLSEYLGNPDPKELSAGRAMVAIDALSLRRVIVAGIFSLVTGRVGPGDLDAAREMVRRAWDARDDSPRFAAADFEMSRQVLIAARLYPALWLLNDYKDVLVQGVSNGPASVVPADYRPAHMELFDALEAGDTARAQEALDDYTKRLDDRIARQFTETA